MNKQSLSMRGLHTCQQGSKSSCRSLSTCRTNLGICSAESEASWDDSQSSKVLAARWPSGSSGPCLLVAPIPYPLFHPGASSSDPLGCTERNCWVLPNDPKAPTSVSLLCRCPIQYFPLLICESSWPFRQQDLRETFSTEA